MGRVGAPRLLIEMRLGILTSHPIQYQVPWFRALARELDVHVYFAHRQSAAEQAAAGYGVAFEWDIDLLEGYEHTFLRNVSAEPNVYSLAGCDTPEIADIVRASHFDAFLLTGWYLKSYLQALRACKRADIPLLVRADSHLGTPRSRLKRIIKPLGYRLLLGAFDACLYVGARSREYFAHYGVPPERLFHAPHFVDNAWFAARAADARLRREEVRRENGLSRTAAVGLFVGRLIESKRPFDFLRAVAKVSPERPVHLAFVGAGPLESQIVSSARELGVDARVLGFRNQSELPAIYAACDFLLLGSEETWGLVVNEAMACGLPAIVSATAGCAPDLIDEGETGYTYPIGDVAALAAAIEALLPRLGSDQVSQALITKLRTYSCERGVEGTLEAVSWVTRSRGAVGMAR